MEANPGAGVSGRGKELESEGPAARHRPGLVTHLAGSREHRGWRRYFLSLRDCLATSTAAVFVDVEGVGSFALPLQGSFLAGEDCTRNCSS